jgi:NAD(P)-dependent dehydrogenase (short-subunit alcohol dehydrogenase family)
MTNSYPFVVSVDEFKGKRVLVTGGTKGIGAAIVRRFELSGASVATTARSEPAAGHAPALSIKADLGTARGAQDVVDRIQREWWARRLGEQCRWNRNKAGAFEHKPLALSVTQSMGLRTLWRYND